MAAPLRKHRGGIPIKNSPLTRDMRLMAFLPLLSLSRVSAAPTNVLSADILQPIGDQPER